MAHKEINPITTSIDVLFTLLIFWGFLEWENITTFAGKVLLVFLYLIIINDWLSCRATYEFYTYEMFIIDAAIIFLFLRMLISLTFGNFISGYKISFWLELAILSILYGIWDYVVSVYTEDKERRKGLRSWGNKMFGTAFVCLISYLSLLWLVDHSSGRNYLFILAEAPSFIIFVILIVFWNREKFQLYKELERRYKRTT